MSDQNNIGNETYYIDLNTKTISKGIVVGMGISTTGYLIADIKVDSAVVSKEMAFIFSSKKEAEKALVRYSAIKGEIDNIKQKATSDLEEKRKEILGEPEFEYLITKPDQ